MTRLSLLLLTPFLLSSCKNNNRNKPISNVRQNKIFPYDPRVHITFDSLLTIADNDQMVFTCSRHKNEPYTRISDSTNSFIQVSGDTLKLFLNDGIFEGCYQSVFTLLPDTAYSTFELFDNYTNYDYLPSVCSIRLNRNAYPPGEYVTLQLYYKTMGKHTTIHRNHTYEDYDTVTVNGKIRLKIRDCNFTYKDFSIEGQRNKFYSLLRQGPETVTSLNLWGCAFTSLPKELTRFVNLQSLELSGNDLSKADLSELKQLRHLKKLELRECNLSRLPESILTLSELECLDVFSNKISRLPEGLYNLISIKELIIAGNYISYLSPKIANLINLETLETSSSQIRVYPKEMVKLKKLKQLYPNDTMEYIPRPLIKYVWHIDTIYHLQ